MKKTLAIAVLIFGITGSSCSSSTTLTSTKTNASSLVDVDKVPDFVPNDDYGRGLWESTKQVYTLRQFRPAWLAQGIVGSSGDAALRVLEDAPSEGLKAEDFWVGDLRRLQESVKTSGNAGAQNEFDTRLTYALVRYAVSY